MMLRKTGTHTSNFMKIKALVLILVMLTHPVLVSAQDESEAADFEKNALELFLGGTYADDEGTNFSICLGYERRLGEKIGLGGFVEHTEGEGREWVLGVPVIFHPTESWKIFLAPGIEHEDGANEFLVRLCNSYEFEMGSWTLAPEFSFDFVDGDVKTVFGLNFGIDF